VGVAEEEEEDQEASRGAAPRCERARRMSGVRLASGETLEASSVVLAVGHSARDMYEHLRDAGVPLRVKQFAMGFRIEHPQARALSLCIVAPLP
jgi:uncharacterized FAD-dependent dehydrogenase